MNDKSKIKSIFFWIYCSSDDTTTAAAAKTNKNMLHRFIFSDFLKREVKRAFLSNSFRVDSGGNLSVSGDASNVEMLCHILWNEWLSPFQNVCNGPRSPPVKSDWIPFRKTI